MKFSLEIITFKWTLCLHLHLFFLLNDKIIIFSTKIFNCRFYQPGVLRTLQIRNHQVVYLIEQSFLILIRSTFVNRQNCFNEKGDMKEKICRRLLPSDTYSNHCLFKAWVQKLTKHFCLQLPWVSLGNEPI